jgi:23S rRNA (uracil1939-C5)-methyltransferase
VNSAMASALHAYVVERARSYAPRSVVDAYAGSGATAVPLADDGVVVTAIELDRYAAQVTEDQLRPPSRSLTGRVEDLLPAALPADVILVNPPRTGLADQIPGQLEAAAAAASALIYVSCNPATLGRDLARLPSYRIQSVRGFDMFPQTAHVETVCELVPVRR